MAETVTAHEAVLVLIRDAVATMSGGSLKVYPVVIVSVPLPPVRIIFATPETIRSLEKSNIDADTEEVILFVNCVSLSSWSLMASAKVWSKPISTTALFVKFTLPLTSISYFIQR
jgi:hypothetical protein